MQEMVKTAKTSGITKEEVLSIRDILFEKD